MSMASEFWLNTQYHQMVNTNKILGPVLRNMVFRRNVRLSLSFFYFKLTKGFGEGNGNSSDLAWRIPWTEEPGRPQSMGSQRVREN